ncbi:prostatic acid phosphatase-like isoform X1 [Haliotis rufescens]|uniref:prostatic acid phosphatase-like isoform X1 n=2 Tax=Haliotis rufescens TaxID=6454 RepID=UPI00201F4B76|nr:prostatic acid phosphatase-like isoform X1 [Haliotis rufescens]
MRLLIVLVLLTAVDIISPSDSTTLRFVQILFRHGDRSPTHVYPTDPYQEDSWPQGFGQLSKVGMQQMYEVGQFIRTRYVGAGFLTANYTNTEIRVQSTDIDRTLMSAYCVLTGLYPPEGSQVWNGTLPWQPIPVHTVPRSEDYLHLHCPAYEKAYEEMMKSPPVIQIQNEHKDLIDYISQHAGLSATLDSLLLIMDPLLCEQIHMKPYPSWLTVNNTADKILQLLDLKGQLRTKTPELVRIRGGPLLGRIIQNMKDQITNNLTKKALLFSAHDSTIEAFLSTMNAFNGLYIPYAASVYVELHVINDAPVVKVLYRNDTTAEPYVLKIKGCGDHCTVSKLEQLTKHMIPADPKATCEGDTHREHVSGATIAVAVLIPVLLAVFLAILAVRFMQERKRQALYRYRPVNEHL